MNADLAAGKDGPSVVLAAVDGSRSSLRACAYAAGVARRQRARLIVVYVQTPVGGLLLADLTGAGTLVPPPAPRDPAELHREVLAVSSDLQDAEFVFLTGDPGSQLVRQAQATRAEVLILGAPESVWHRWMGSLASRLVRASVCPVTVVP